MALPPDAGTRAGSDPQTLAALLDVNLQPMWLTDAQGLLLHGNAAFLRLLGVDQQALRLHRWFDFLHPTDHHEANTAWASAVRTHHDYEFACRLRTGASDYQWVRMLASTYRDAAGVTAYVVGSCYRVSDPQDDQGFTHEQVLRTLRDSNIIGYVVLCERVITHANDAFLAIVGYSREDLAEGRIDWVALNPPEYDDQANRKRIEVAVTGIATPYDKEYVRKDGTRVAVSVSVAMISANPSKVIGFITDRSEQVKLLQAEREARQRAEQLNLMKTDFLRTVSHELRTPLTAILGWTDVLESSADDAATVARAAEVIKRNASSELLLVSDLLSASEMLAEHLTVGHDRINIWQLVDAVATAHQPAAARKGLKLHWTYAEGVDEVVGDHQQLLAAFGKLVENAIKFTTAGGQITLSIATAPTEVGVTVADTGQGITSEFMPHIFDWFSQEDAKLTRRFGGVGLGLALVRTIILAHGGTIAAHSEGAGLGTSFSIVLPLGLARLE